MCDNTNSPKHPPSWAFLRLISAPPIPVPVLERTNRWMQRSISFLSAAKPIHCALDSGACPGSPVSSYAACSVTASFQMK